MKTDSELQQIFLSGYGQNQTVANRELYDAGYSDGHAAGKGPQPNLPPTTGVDFSSDGTQPKITGTDIVAPPPVPPTPGHILQTPVVKPLAAQSPTQPDPKLKKPVWG
jgi:hypothetical protein